MQIAYVSSDESTQPDFVEDYAKFCFLWYDHLVFMDADQAIDTIVKKEGLSRKHRADFTDIALPFDAFIKQQKLPDYIEDKEVEGKFSAFGKKLHDKSEVIYTGSQLPGGEIYSDRDARRLTDHGPVGGPRLWGNIDEIRKHQQKKIEEKIEFSAEHYNRPFRNIHRWAVLNQAHDCEFIGNTFTQAGIELVLDEVNALSTDQDGTQKENLDVQEVLHLKVPCYKEVSWDRVIELKRTGRFGKLKDKAMSLYGLSGKDIDKTTETLNKEIIASNDDIVAHGEPNVKSVWVRVIASVSSSPVPYAGNALDIFSSVRRIRAEQERERNLRWYYTLRELGGIKLKVAD